MAAKFEVGAVVNVPAGSRVKKYAGMTGKVVAQARQVEVDFDGLEGTRKINPGDLLLGEADPNVVVEPPTSSGGGGRSRRGAKREPRAPPTSTDREKAQGIVEAWDVARLARDYESADPLRAELRSMGFEPGSGGVLHLMR